MEPDLWILFCILSFLFGLLVGKTFFSKSITVHHVGLDDPADWWKHGKEPPDYEA